MKKILVAGGAGYIGSHVAKALRDAGFAVRVYDNLSTGQKINLFADSEFVEGDIQDYAKLNEAMSGIDGVVHLAAKKAVGESMEKPEIYSNNNISGSLNILNAMASRGVKNMVFSSSSAVYGNPDYTPIDEKHPIKPVSYYGFTKAEIEKFMAWYDELKGVKYIALRYFNAVGYDAAGEIKGRGSDNSNLLPIIVDVAKGKKGKLQIYGNDYDTRDGTCLRDYVHVSDLASAHVLAMTHLMNGGKSDAFNLGTANGTSVKEIVEACEKFLGRKINVEYVPRRPGDPAVTCASFEKASKVLGWKPEYTDIEDIIKTCF